MKSAIIVFPGLNRDQDMISAITKVSGIAPQTIWHADGSIPDVDLVVIPGGFSYGDYLRPGAIAARSPILADLKRHIARGGRALGICNGFQILTESGLLPGTLMRNSNLKFICKEVHLRVERTDLSFTSRYEAGQILRCPVAHHDGNFFASNELLSSLEENEQVAFRYCDASGDPTTASNPNGSRNNIAGVINKAGNVLGMMPHPENFIETEHGGTDGRPLFESAFAAIA